LEEFAGQQHFLGEGGLLTRMLAADQMTSVIFWGPPGTGKTTLAEVIANHTGRHFERSMRRAAAQEISRVSFTADLGRVGPLEVPARVIGNDLRPTWFCRSRRPPEDD